MQLTRLRTLAASAALACAVSTAALAGDCTRIAAVGDGPTKDIATVMSTHGLENIIEARGLKATGPVKTTCEAGSFLTECHSSQSACK